MKTQTREDQDIPERSQDESLLSCGVTSALPSPCCTILESISDGVFTVDLQRRITSFNRAAETITGFSRKEAMGQYCFDIFRANVCERNCALDRTMATEISQVHLNASIISKTGEQKPISISTAVLKDQQGKVIGGVETFRDLSDLEQLRRELTRGYTYEDIVGNHPSIREIVSFLPDIAVSDSPVLIEGPTGSGKELFARAIHALSSRRDGPFIAVNCAALPDTLLESELFGYSKGAFTGATRNKPGRFLLADKGTLFLDEISNTSTAFQADLLRVLEDGEYTPLGARKSRRTDFRVVAASNLDLKEWTQDGRFREDLYYRLNVVKISLPPLRERKEDIPLLVNHFIRKFNLRQGRSIQGVAPEVLSFLMGYAFPGNIRELANIIEYAFIPCKGDLIGMNHLSKDLLTGSGQDEPVRAGAFRAVHNEEAAKIREALQQHQGNRIETARSLAMSRSTLWRKMKKFGLIE
jgi:PAS domain S-box-containing protein